MTPATRRDWVQLHVAVLLFGVAGLFGPAIDLPSVGVVLGRTLFATVALWCWVAVNPRPSRRRTFRRSGWSAVAGGVLGLHWLTFFASIQLGSVATGVLTFAAYPLFTTMLAWSFGDRPTRGNWLAAGVILVGVGLLGVPQGSSPSENATFAVGCGLVSAALFAVFTRLNQILATWESAARLAAEQTMIAAVVMTPLAIWTCPLPTTTDLLRLAVLGVGCTAVAQGLFVAALPRVGAPAASLVATLEAIYGTVLAWLIFHQVPSRFALVGGILILGAATAGSCAAAPAPRITRA